MKILSKMMLVFTALLLTSTLAIGQNMSQEELKKAQEPRSVVPKAYGAKAVGDDCSNPILVPVSAYPFTFDDNGQTTEGHGNNYESTAMGSYDGGYDIVYKINVPTSGVFTFKVTPTVGWSAIGIFEGCPGSDNMITMAKNNSYTAAPYTATASLIDPAKDYYVMIDIYPSPLAVGFDLSITAASAEPRLEAVTDPINLGPWPVNGWQECRPVEFTNIGTGDASITNVELDDPDNAFKIVMPVEMPYTLPVGETKTISNVVGKPTTAGVHEAVYVASFNAAGKGVSSTHVKLEAYDAPQGDIFEKPFEVTALPYSVAGVSTATMHKNYLPDVTNNGKDVVYKFTLDADKLVTLRTPNNTGDLSLYLYEGDFQGKPGPMSTNVRGTADQTGFTAQALFAGTYYAVISGSNAAADITFDMDVTAVDMPAPAKPYDPDPDDTEMSVEANGSELTWKFPAYAAEYRVAFGTNYANNPFVVDWTPIPDTLLTKGGVYELPNLLPNTQYFWRVDVRNSNGTTLGDNWGFTTVITQPAELTATVVDTNDVELAWEYDMSKVFKHFNIYRDGVMIKDNYTETTYKDMDLAHGCYSYGVEAIYDEGASAKSNTGACILGVATVQGVVTDITTGNPIPGATVALDGETDYTFTTDADGKYEGEVWEGTYDYTASAQAYTSESLNGEVVAWNTTVIKDFALDDDPQPVEGPVSAIEIDPSTVEVRWEKGGSTPVPGDGLSEDFEAGVLPTGWTIVDADGDGHNWDAAFLFGQGQGHDGSAGMIGSASYDNPTSSALTPDNYLITPELNVGSGATLTFWVCGQDANWAAEHYAVYASSTGNDVADFTNMLFEETIASKAMNSAKPAIRGSKAQGAWAQKTVEVPAGTKYIAFRHFNSTDMFFLDLDDVEITPNRGGEKSVTGFNVYRVLCNDETQSEFLGMTLDSTFTDHNWGDIDWGSYKWGVETLYTNYTSDIVYSNCLDKNMQTSVDVKVTTNSGDSPAGTIVKFTNVSEPSLAWELVLNLDATGMESCDTIRRGHYDIEVKQKGFETINLTDVVIEADTAFEWMLIEEIYKPFDLWVSPTGYATWNTKEVVEASGINETFDVAGTIPDGWVVEDNGSTHPDYNWKVVADYRGKTMDDGTPFVIIDSDQPGSGNSMNAYLVSPAVDNSAAANVTVEFHQNFQWVPDPNNYAEVDVWNGSEWVNLVKQEEDLPVPGGSALASFDLDDVVTTLDATAYKNANFKVRFHYAGTWDWWWAIDNVKVFDNTVTPPVAQKDAKVVQGYKVWLDDVFKADTPDTWYQHDMSELTAGESYTTAVSTLYSTGLSDTAIYTWTYVPCDQYEGPKTVGAERVDATENAKVTWSYTASTAVGEDLVEDFEAGVLPTGWTIVDADGDGHNWDAAFLFGQGQGHDGSAGMVGSASYDNPTSSALTPDNYLITPELNVGSGATLTFWVCGQDANWAAEHYAVYASSTGNDVADFTNMLFEETIASKAMNSAKPAIRGSKAQGAWAQKTVEVPAGTKYIAFRHFNSTDMFFLDLDDVEIIANRSGAKSLEHLGTNVYRDGEFLTYVALPDTTYVDEGLILGTTYNYCVASVYTEDGGDHTFTSCTDAVCTSFTMPENCIAPNALTATDLPNDGKKVTLNWHAPGSSNFDPTWLDYGSTTNADAVGAGGTPFAVAHKYPVGSMNEYEGGVITKIKMFIGETLTAGTLKVWQGANGEDLILSQTMDNITIGDWNEFDLDTPVAFDVTQDLWVGYSVDAYNGYPAGCGDPVDPNADWLFFNNAWAHLPDLAPSLVNAWNIGFYVDAAKAGFEPTYVTYEDNTNYTAATDAILAAGGVTSVNTVDPYTNAATAAERGLLGYNVYRDGVKVNNSVVTETTYVEMNLPANHRYCWQVTAVYETCGESDFSNEVCLDLYDGVDEFNSAVSVYPNPAKDYVKIEANSTIEQVCITNMAGQVIKRIEAIGDSNLTIDTQAFGAGVYFVEVATTAGAKKVKLVITK